MPCRAAGVGAAHTPHRCHTRPVPESVALLQAHRAGPEHGLEALLCEALLVHRQSAHQRSGHSFWLRPTDGPPSTLIEQFVHSVFRTHADGAPERAGAEWWVQHRWVNLDDNELENESLRWHWDRDEALASNGPVVHPNLSTVTYLTSAGGPLGVFEQQCTGQGEALPPAGLSGTGGPRFWLVQPESGRHVSFDGSLLHCVAAHLTRPEHRQACADGQRQQRVSLLVNIWFDHQPQGAASLSTMPWFSQLSPAVASSTVELFDHGIEQIVECDEQCDEQQLCFSSGDLVSFCNVPVSDAHAIVTGPLLQQPLLQYLPAMEDENDADCWISRGDVLCDLHQLELAKESYVHATQLADDDVEAWTSLGNVCVQLGELESATESYGQATTLEPDDADLWSYLGTVFSKRGMHQRAVEAFSNAVLLEPTPSAHSRLMRGNALYATGATDRAMQDYEAVLALQPDNTQAHTNRSNAIVRLHWQAASSLLPVEAKILDPYCSRTLGCQGAHKETPLHSVYCAHWLEPRVCNWLRQAIERFGAQPAGGGWETHRHADRATTDIELSCVPEIKEWMAGEIRSTLLPTLGALFAISTERLRVREVFCVKYAASGQAELGLHRDGHLLSFNILISEPSEYQGGGTVFQGLNETIHLEQQGNVLLHCGKQLHGGNRVSQGIRMIIVGFVEALQEDSRPFVDLGQEFGESGDSDLECLQWHWERLH